MYKPVLPLLANMLNKDKAATVQKAIGNTIHDFMTWVSVYGSDESVRAFRNFMQASYTAAPPAIFLRLYGEFVLAARRDIGYSDTEASVEDVLAIRLNDLYKEGGLKWVANEPFEAVCERLSWKPPWFS